MRRRSAAPPFTSRGIAASHHSGAKRAIWWAVALALVPFLLASCKSAPQVRGKIAGLRNLADRAEESGAKKCAPRELALARAYLEFAELALDQGSVSRARNHLSAAEVNGRAAQLQSPAEFCTPQVKAQPAKDRDGDGYLDPKDDCPEEAENFNGFEDLDGCPDSPDTDADGLDDLTDPCVILAEDADGYLDEDGCPEPDNDLDGLLDEEDECPQDPEDPDGYQDADGCPDPDNDGDEVPDVEDQCPNTPGQTEDDPLGCPKKPALVVVTDCEVKITQQIHFAFGKAVIRAQSYPVLNAVVEVLKKNPSIKLQIQGHTDSVGSNEANLELSEERAASVRRYLVARGIDISRLESKGFGEEKPLVANNSKENRALNRRVQFMRTEGQKAACEEAKNQTESASSPSTVGPAQ